ncbi:MAG: uroporphyrinogen decarboxylase family protein [Bacillota bacterium]|nr:uroporphyrinogen decarboxylase family protein [Bacillota bacterium]
MPRLIDLVRIAGRRLVVPLLGYPGAQLTCSSLKQNEFNPVLHCESICRLVDRFSPDAAFFMMDLSVEAGALGLPVRYPLYESPTVEEHPVRSLADLEAFKVLDPLDDALVQARIRAMELMKERLDVPRGGYVIGPFTLAGLLMGASELAMATITDPDLVHGVVGFCTDVCVRYARALAAAGADMIAILEPTATFLSPQAFDTFCGAYIRGLITEVTGNPGMTGAAPAGDVAGGTDATGGRAGAGARTATGTTDAADKADAAGVRNGSESAGIERTTGATGSASRANAPDIAGPRRADAMTPMMILHICGDTSHLVRNMCATGAHGLSLDSPVDFARAAREADPEVVLIGNVDPVGVMVQETPDGVRRAVRALLDMMEPYENFILSTGCDLPYETPFENIDAFMKEGRL